MIISRPVHASLLFSLILAFGTFINWIKYHLNVKSKYTVVV